MRWWKVRYSVEVGQQSIATPLFWSNDFLLIEHSKSNSEALLCVLFALFCVKGHNMRPWEKASIKQNCVFFSKKSPIKYFHGEASLNSNMLSKKIFCDCSHRKQSSKLSPYSNCFGRGNIYIYSQIVEHTYRYNSSVLCWFHRQGHKYTGLT